ncbi:hypothetical protein BST61_g11486 [Cercospora zeina]
MRRQATSAAATNMIPIYGDGEIFKSHSREGFPDATMGQCDCTTIRRCENTAAMNPMQTLPTKRFCAIKRSDRQLQRQGCPSYIPAAAQGPRRHDPPSCYRLRSNPSEDEDNNATACSRIAGLNHIPDDDDHKPLGPLILPSI